MEPSLTKPAEHVNCPSPDYETVFIPLEKGQIEEREDIIERSYTPHRPPRANPMPLPYCSE